MAEVCAAGARVLAELEEEASGVSGQQHRQQAKRATKARRKRPSMPSIERPSTPDPFQNTNRQAPGSARVRQTSLPNLERPNTPGSDPLGQTRMLQDSLPKAPCSARVRRSSDLAPYDVQPAPQSARTSRQRVSSLPNLVPKSARIDDEPDIYLFAAAPKKKAVAKSQEEQDMDALDGLLASLDEERETKSDVQKNTSPRTPTKIQCGIGPARNSKVVTGNFCTGSYDDELVLSTPRSIVDLDDSMAASVYCPLSPTIMSVHLPGSPIIPHALELDDTASSVVYLGERSKSHEGPRVRFSLECRDPGVADSSKYGPRTPCRRHARIPVCSRYEPLDEDSDTYEPQMPCRRPLGTGRLSSRPLGQSYRDLALVDDNTDVLGDKYPEQMSCRRPVGTGRLGSRPLGQSCGVNPDPVEEDSDKYGLEMHKYGPEMHSRRPAGTGKLCSRPPAQSYSLNAEPVVEDIDKYADKYVPEMPSRRLSGTGKPGARPLGCTRALSSAAGFGGA